MQVLALVLVLAQYPVSVTATADQKLTNKIQTNTNVNTNTTPEIVIKNDVDGSTTGTSINAYSNTVLDLREPNNCNSVHAMEANFNHFWTSPMFLEIVEKTSKETFEAELKKKLDAAMEEELRYARAFYEKLNVHLLSQREGQRKNVVDSIFELESTKFIAAVKMMVKEKSCAKAEKDLKDSYEKIERFGKTQELANKFFKTQFDPEFLYGYYKLDGQPCRNTYIEPLTKLYTEETPYFTEAEKKKVDEKTTQFLNKKGTPQRNDERDYLNFIDYNIVNTPKDKNSFHLLANRGYLPIHLFKFLFDHYDNSKPKTFELFTEIYQIINDFRLDRFRKLPNEPVTDVIGEFAKYLERELQELNKFTYFFIKLFMGMGRNDQPEIAKINPNVKLDPKDINSFITDNPELKGPAKQIVTDNNIDLVINKKFNDLMNEDDPKKFNQMGAELIDGTDNIEDIEEAIEELVKVKDVNDKNLFKYEMLRRIVFENIFGYFVHRVEFNKETVERYMNLIKAIAKPLNFFSPRSATDSTLELSQSSDPKKPGDLLTEIFEVIDNKFKTDFRVSYINFKLLMSSDFVVNDFADESLRYTNESLHGNLCREIEFDFAVFGRNYDIAASANDKGKKKRQMCAMKVDVAKIDDNFLEHFVKLISYVRSFKFYKSVNNNAIIHSRFYKTSIINKMDYKLNTFRNDMPLAMDTLIEKVRTGEHNLQQYSNIVYDIRFMAEAFKILNLKNFDIRNAEVVRQVKFNKIRFSNMNRIVSFHMSLVQKEFTDYIEILKGHFSGSAEHYEFNNIDMIFNIHSIIMVRTETIDADKISKDINTIIAATNSDIKGNNDKILSKDIEISRRVYLFAYTDSILKSVEMKTKGMILEKVTTNDIKKLSVHNQVELFHRYIIPHAPDLNRVDIPQNNQRVVITPNFITFIKEGVDRLQKLNAQKGILYKVIAVDYFKILISTDKKEGSAEPAGLLSSGIMDILVENFIEASRINRASNYFNSLQKIGEMSAAFKNIEGDELRVHDMLLVIYYFMVETLRDFSYAIDNKVTVTNESGITNQALFNNHINEKFNQVIRKYIEQTTGPEKNTRKVYGFDVENLLVVAKLMFGRLFMPDQLQIDISGKSARLNYMFAMIALDYLKGVGLYSDTKPMQNIEGAIANLNKQYPFLEKFNKQKLTQSLNNAMDNILEPRCQGRVFALFINMIRDQNDVAFLERIVDGCMEEPNEFLRLENAYRLLNDVEAFTMSDKSKNTMNGDLKKLFVDTLEKIRNKLQKPAYIIPLIKGVITGQKTIYFNGDFQKFIANVTTNYTKDDVYKKVDAMAKKLNIEAANIDTIKRQYIKDVILLYQDNLGSNDPKAKFNIDNIELNNTELWNLLTENSRFATFLTNLFSGYVFHSKNIDDYLELYIFINNFRVNYLRTYELWNGGVSDDTTEAQKQFSQYLDNAIENASDKSLRTKLYFLKIMLKISSGNISTPSDGQDCGFYSKILEILSSGGALSTVNGQKVLNDKFDFANFINTSELKKLVEENATATSFFKYMYTIAYGLLKNTGLSKDFKQPPIYCGASKSKYIPVLNAWSSLYISMFGEENPRARVFTNITNYSQLRFHLSQVYNQYRLLL